MRLGNWLRAARLGTATVGAAVSLACGAGTAAAVAAPIVGGAQDPVAAPAYWLVGSDGAVFDFGGAPFYGSELGQALNAPVVGIAATPDGKGYWLTGSDGGIFNFGDAGFYGSEGGKTLNAPIVGIAATPDGKGYRLLGSGETVYDFGDAVADGSTPGGAAPPTARPPAPPAPVVTVPVTTPIPRPRARRSLKIRLSISWTWNRAVTELRKVEIGRFPSRAALVVQCRGRACPGRRKAAAAGTKRLRRLLASLEGRRYRAGDRLLITFTARGYLAERAEVIIRNGKLPLVKLLPGGG